MQRSYSFWKNLPPELGFSSWPDLAACLIVNVIIALVLGAIICAILGYFTKGLGWKNGILIGILFFALIKSLKQISYSFSFLYGYVFNK